MMKICMMRHGEAMDDIEDCYGGIADFELSDGGRKQAKKLAEDLAKHELQVIYTSPLKRAKETADILCSQLALDAPSVIQAIHERNSYGMLSGLNKDKAKIVFASILAGLKEKPGYSKEPIPGYEPWDDFVVRIRSGFETIIIDATAKKLSVIGIVIHGKFTQALFDDVLGIEQEFNLKLSALNVLHYQPQSAELA